MGIVLKNNARTTLSSGISSLDTTIPVSDTSDFPALGVGEYFYATIESTAGAHEIIKVTQVNASSFVAVRGQESTIAIPFNTGARVELRITVQSLEDQFGVAVPDAVDDYLDTQLGVTVQAYDADTAKLDVIQDWTARQTFNDGVYVNNTGASDPTQIVLERDGAHRWAFFRNNTAESGADAGSNLDLYSYTDAGSLKDLIYRITRSSGVLDFKVAPTLNGAAYYTAGGTDVPVTDGGTGASTAIAATANLGAPYIIAQSGAAVSHTGNTNETALVTVTIPADVMGANGTIDVETVWSYTNNANNKTLRVRFGGVSGTQYLSNIVTTSVAVRDFRSIVNRNSKSSQVGSHNTGVLAGGWGSNSAAVMTSSVNTANAVDLVISGQLAIGTDTVTLEYYKVTLRAKA